MASPAQCFYCFECLSASFEDREHADLEVIEELWEQYEQIKKLAAIEGNNESVSIGEDGKRGQQAVPNDDDGRSTSTYNRPGALRLPSINHLQSSSESSSAATTPSLASNSSQSISSSSTTLTTPTLQSPASEIPKLGFQKRKYRSHPLFVTWDVLKRGRKSLRGCIGTFEAKELSDGLKSYALISYVSSCRWFKRSLLLLLLPGS